MEIGQTGMSVLLLPRWQCLARGLFFLQTQRPVSLHQRVDVARALVDDRGLAVAPVALDQIGRASCRERVYSSV